MIVSISLCRRAVRFFFPKLMLFRQFSIHSSARRCRTVIGVSKVKKKTLRSKRVKERNFGPLPKVVHLAVLALSDLRSNYYFYFYLLIVTSSLNNFNRSLFPNRSTFGLISFLKLYCRDVIRLSRE